MRRIVLLTALLAGGCTDPAIVACESYVKERLKSPSSYQRVDAFVVSGSEKGERRHHVMLDYDADNSFGASLRASEICIFREAGGQLELIEF